MLNLFQQDPNSDAIAKSAISRASHQRARAPSDIDEDDSSLGVMTSSMWKHTHYVIPINPAQPLSPPNVSVLD